MRDFESACEELLREASHALGNRYAMSGISEEAGFLELVEINTRKYNLRLNSQDEPEAEDAPQFRNPYWRAKQGL